MHHIMTEIRKNFYIRKVGKHFTCMCGQLYDITIVCVGVGRHRRQRRRRRRRRDARKRNSEGRSSSGGFHSILREPSCEELRYNSYSC